MNTSFGNVLPKYRHISDASKCSGISRYHLKQLISQGAIKSVSFSSSIYIDMDDLLCKLSNGTYLDAKPLLDNLAKLQSEGGTSHG